MKTFILFLTAAALLHAADLNISLINPPASGTLRVLLFDSATAFDGLDNPFFSKSFAADGQTNPVLSGLPVGTFALVVHHDENSDGRINKNLIGIPREPVGFANGYAPKGPPSYSRAQIRIAENGSAATVELRRPLGERGRIGAGVGVIFSSSPYGGSDSATVIPIPAITYTGERLQIFGPQARYLIAEPGPVRLGLAANYRPPAYDEDDSPLLLGLGDRDGTLLAGPEVIVELPAAIDLSLGYRHDVLDQIGGGEATAELDRSYSIGTLRLTPSVGIRWTSEELVRHDYGTPAYRPGSMFSVEAGLSAGVELTESWWLAARIGIERLGSEATDSPIVGDDVKISGFLAASYLF